MTGFADRRLFIYHIDAGNRITFLNPEWIEFARENGAAELTPENLLGRSLERFIAGWETKHLYEIIYESARRSGREISFPFRCDSPDRRRFFEMRIRPIGRGSLEFNVRVVRTEPRTPLPLLDSSAGHTPTVVVICSWCRRIRVENSRWAEIENALEELDLLGATPPSLSHGVCPDCFSTIRRNVDT